MLVTYSCYNDFFCLQSVRMGRKGGNRGRGMSDIVAPIFSSGDGMLFALHIYLTYVKCCCYLWGRNYYFVITWWLHERFLRWTFKRITLMLAPINVHANINLHEYVYAWAYGRVFANVLIILNVLFSMSNTNSCF